MEQAEIDWTPRCANGTLPRDAHIVRWANELLDAMDGFVRPIRLNSNLTKRQMAEAGFVDIREEVIRLPFHGWPAEAHGKNLGRWFNLGIRQACQPLILAPLTRGRGWAPDEIRALSEYIRGEAHSNTAHAYCTL
jgi:hypothetical protein